MTARCLLIVAFALASCRSGATSRVGALYGGEANWSVIQAPSQVQAWRVMPPGRVRYVRAPDTVDGFEITDGPRDVDLATARELASILAADAIYDWERAKGCEFEPGLAVRFSDGAASVDVLFCFHCDELAAFRDGKRAGIEDFDAARDRLAALAERMFPTGK